MAAALRYRCQAGGRAKERGRRVDNQVVTGPSFRFRLERVRAVRERKETLAKQDLARSISRLSSTQEELRSAEAQLEHARDEQRDAVAQPGTVAGGELQARQAFLERAEQRRRSGAIELQRSEAEVADRNAKLVTAAGEHEMLNRLKHRRRVEHDRESARVEGKALDEMAATRSHRSLA
jgi:flagellar export protein FliJ